VLRSRYGVRTALMPMFLNAAQHMAKYKAISYGFSDWGTRSPVSTRDIGYEAAASHRMHRPWMQTIAVQDARPNQQTYFEADNLTELRDSWQSTIHSRADWVQLATWNDYSESTAIAPSVAHGYSFLDVSAYYAARYETGHWPTVTRDALYLTNRDQFAHAKPTGPETLLMHLRTPSSRPRNDIEVQSFLTRSATVSVAVGGKTTSWQAPAGVSVHDVPLGYGAVSATATVAGRTVASVTSPTTVKRRPHVQDLQYYAAGSRR
jgi:hypothetical protein